MLTVVALLAVAQGATAISGAILPASSLWSSALVCQERFLA